MIRSASPWKVCLLLTLASALAAGAGGCSSSSKASLSSWQKSVTDYVNDKGAGDPVALRDVTLPDGRAGFSQLGQQDAAASTDANGVLLGYEQAGGHLWFVYLVGLVEKERVTDIRLAAMSMDRGKAMWKRGPAPKSSLDAYRRHGAKQAAERLPGRESLPPRYAGFPKPDDVFKLTKGNGGKLVATHDASGARWEVTLAQK